MPKQGGEYTVTIDSKIPVYLECHDLGGDVSISSITTDILLSEIYDKNDVSGGVYRSIEGKTLKISVTATQSKKASITEIPLYDFAGTSVAKVTIIQDGDSTLPSPKLGNPYLTSRIVAEDSYNVPRTPEDDILDDLEDKVCAAIDDLEEKRNLYDTNANDLFFVSKDVARVLLANIYMYRGKYADAKPLLEKVVSNGFYSINSEADDCIMGYDYRPMTRAFERTVPLFTFSDVLLSLVECENSLGNESEAWQYAKHVSSVHNTFSEIPEPSDMFGNRFPIGCADGVLQLLL